MDNKTKKAQVVLVAVDSSRQSFEALLLQTNDRRGAFWQNVTGKIEDNETFEEGALREAIEETQLKVENIVDIIDLGINLEFTDQRKRKVHEKCFLIILESKWDVKIDSSEHKDFKWVALDKITPGILEYKSNEEALQKALQILKHWGV